MECDNFIVSEQEALGWAASYDGPVVVDLDETLYLQNSTADFISCAVPGVVALLLLKCLDLIAPWRWTGGRSTRDNWRVRLILAVFPWTRMRWRSHCRKHADALTNRPLLDALRARGQPFIVATNGFETLVRPLMAAMGCGDAQTIACRIGRASDRARGKAALIEDSIGSRALAEALVITDSTEDADVLNRCRQPCLTRWSAARSPQRPFQWVYLPGIYTIAVNAPGDNRVFNQTLGSQIYWLIIPLTSGQFSLRLEVAAIAFFWSFWAIYEVGYRDNDMCAVRYEEHPVLPPRFASFRDDLFEFKAWVFAIVVGGIALCILQTIPSPWLALAWVGLLVATRLTFWIYNRLDKATRVWLYLLLSVQREAGFLIFAAANAVGVSAVIARILAKWIVYIVYRYGTAVGVRSFPKLPIRIYRLGLFLVLLGGAAITSPVANGKTFLISAALLFLYHLIPARYEIAAIVRSAQRIDRAKADRSSPVATDSLDDEASAEGRRRAKPTMASG